MNWYKIRKEHGRYILGSTSNGKPFPKGVSVSSERIQDEYDGQHSIEHIAVDGVIKHNLDCYNGQQRDNAINRAISLFKGTKTCKY